MADDPLSSFIVLGIRLIDSHSPPEMRMDCPEGQALGCCCVPKQKILFMDGTNRFSKTTIQRNCDKILEDES
ncbi:hypothetical protein Ahy_A07g031217 isoform D [Arachis hypogaea]|uniref:Uncharacterized protein n=1 Tax=Arachis hypogaea TaxID=3818 RepID=A0A445C379_ARAHY|nr:hypothetical protein Ahy_A07g031217 isoform D [Arachis hypogaea]